MKNRMAKFVLFVTMTLFLFGMSMKWVSADIFTIPKDEPIFPIELEA